MVPPLTPRRRRRPPPSCAATRAPFPPASLRCTTWRPTRRCWCRQGAVCLAELLAQRCPKRLTAALPAQGVCEGWRAAREWVLPCGGVDIGALERHFGGARVTVTDAARCVSSCGRGATHPSLTTHSPAHAAGTTEAAAHAPP